MTNENATCWDDLPTRIKNRIITGWFLKIGFGIVLLIGALMSILPRYNVWQRSLKGKAELRQAEWNRQIAVKEAEAKKEAAQSLADAEIIRAEGVAKANEIIGASLKENEAYLRYLWIQGLQDGSSEVIYIQTEANLPILEATRKLQ